MLHFTSFQNQSDAEWVTFIHGAGGSSSIWYKQIRAFHKQYNVLLIDLRGHGKSKGHIKKKLKRYTFDEIGDEVIEVLDHLNVGYTHFVGISLGTIIIRELSDRYPGRVKSLIMSGAIMKLNFQSQILMWLGDTLKSVIPYMVLYRLFAFIILPRNSHRESRLLFIREAKKLYHNEFKRWFTLTAEINPLLSLFRMEDASVPTLYVMGEEDYMFLPSVSKLVRDHNNAELFVIPQCGHVVNVEQPILFNQKVLEFLNNRTSF